MLRTSRRLQPTLLATVLALAACGDDSATTSAGTGSGGAPSSSTAVTSGEGGGTGGEGVTSALVSVGSQSGAGGGEGCANQESEGTLVVRPVDVIFVIDNSGSMSGEIVEVEQEISSNFATIIEAANPPIDYRVIMVSSYGKSEDQRICIPEPLGGAPDLDGDGHCDFELPEVPMEGERYFHFDPDQAVDSTDSLCHLIEDYSAPDRHGLHPNGYGELLRTEALKVFVVITDDRVSIGGGDCPDVDDESEVEEGEAAAVAWDAAILGVDFLQFGTLDQRNYVFHSIVALEPFLQDNLAIPHPPESPIVTEVCTPDAQAPGTGYQAISRLTGGLRYPTCGLDYTPIFQRIAEGIIEGSAVACELQVPEAPPGEELDPDSVRVVYDPGDGADPVTFTRVESAGECTADGFILDEASGTITLCPQACSLVQADDDAHLRVVFDCVELPG